LLSQMSSTGGCHGMNACTHAPKHAQSGTSYGSIVRNIPARPYRRGEDLRSETCFAFAAGNRQSAVVRKIHTARIDPREVRYGFPRRRRGGRIPGD
jgi:hypothetical protein